MHSVQSVIFGRNHGFFFLFFSWLEFFTVNWTFSFGKPYLYVCLFSISKKLKLNLLFHLNILRFLLLFFFLLVLSYFVVVFCLFFQFLLLTDVCFAFFLGQFPMFQVQLSGWLPSTTTILQSKVLDFQVHVATERASAVYFN